MAAITVTELVSDQTKYVGLSGRPKSGKIKIGDEQMEIRGLGPLGPDTGPRGQDEVPDAPVVAWVRRGYGGTLATTHAAGSIVTEMLERRGGFVGKFPPR